MMTMSCLQVQQAMLVAVSVWQVVVVVVVVL